MSRLFFAGCIGDTCSSVRYLMREEKERFARALLAVIGIQSKTFAFKKICEVKSKIQSEITKKFAKKCLDASSRAQPPLLHCSYVYTA